MTNFFPIRYSTSLVSIIGLPLWCLQLFILGCLPAEKVEEIPAPSLVINTTEHILPASLQRVTQTFVDGSGNLYSIAASHNSDAQSERYTLSKFNPDGMLAWDRVFLTTPLPVSIPAPSLAIDASGNAYVLGSQTLNAGAFPDNDWYFAKYDPAGTLLWEQRLSSPKANVNSIDYPIYAFISSGGQLNILGAYNTDLIYATQAESTLYPPPSQLLLSAYDTNGNALWQTALNTTNPIDYLVEVAHSADKLYLRYDDVVDTDYESGIANEVISQYDTLGNLVWENQINNPTVLDQLSFNIYSTISFIDSSGNLYITKLEGSNFRYLLQKWSADGTLLWNNPIRTRALALSSNSLGEIILLGPDYSLVKFDANGQKLAEIANPDIQRVFGSDLIQLQTSPQDHMVLSYTRRGCFTTQCDNLIQRSSAWTEVKIFDSSLLELATIQAPVTTPLQLDQSGNIYLGYQLVRKYNLASLLPALP